MIIIRLATKTASHFLYFMLYSSISAFLGCFTRLQKKQSGLLLSLFFVF